MDGAEILLIGLAVRMILVEHIWRARLHLGLEDSKPQVLSLHGLPAFTLLLQARVHDLKLLTPHIHEALPGRLVESLVGTEKSPVLIVLHALHEEIRDPKPIEKITCTLLLL